MFDTLIHNRPVSHPFLPPWEPLPSVQEMLDEIERGIDQGPLGPLVYPTFDDVVAAVEARNSTPEPEPEKAPAVEKPKDRTKAVATKRRARAKVIAPQKKPLAIEAAIAAVDQS